MWSAHYLTVRRTIMLIVSPIPLDMTMKSMIFRTLGEIFGVMETIK